VKVEVVGHQERPQQRYGLEIGGGGTAGSSQSPTTAHPRRRAQAPLDAAAVPRRLRARRGGRHPPGRRCRGTRGARGSRAAPRQWARARRCTCGKTRPPLGGGGMGWGVGRVGEWAGVGSEGKRAPGWGRASICTQCAAEEGGQAAAGSGKGAAGGARRTMTEIRAAKRASRWRTPKRSTASSAKEPAADSRMPPHSGTAPRVSSRIAIALPMTSVARRQGGMGWGGGGGEEARLACGAGD
jgi:hypothetical protein